MGVNSREAELWRWQRWAGNALRPHDVLAVKARRLGLNDIEVRIAIGNGGGGDPAVKGGEASTMVFCQCEKVKIRHPRWGELCWIC